MIYQTYYMSFTFELDSLLCCYFSMLTVHVLFGWSLTKFSCPAKISSPVEIICQDLVFLKIAKRLSRALCTKTCHAIHYCNLCGRHLFKRNKRNFILARCV